MDAESSQPVWIVEDEQRIAQVLETYLTQAGFKVTHFADGKGLVERVGSGAPALILLDVTLPGDDGMDLCKRIRGISAVPVIMVTARAEEIDRLLGLELGADDYICKPFSPREVVARVKTVLRRVQTLPNDSDSERKGARYRCAGFDVDCADFRATLDGMPLALTPKEFKMLAAFVSNPGRVLSRDHLMDRMYDDEEFFSDRMIDSHLKNLRRKIAAVRPGFDCIQTVYGIGYRFTNAAATAGTS